MERNGFRSVSRKRRYRIVVFSVVGLGIVALTFIATWRTAGLFKERSENVRTEISVYDLWTAGRYSEVVQIAESRLSDNPMDRDALLYAGYSRYFLAISKVSAEERNADLDAAIRHLRILKARGDTPNPERVDYVLGKAYLFKGDYWADLAALYLQASLDAGYIAEDIYEFLGQAQANLGELDKALEWYELAAKTHPTDRLMITLGEQAFRLGRYDEAVQYYRRAIDETKDESLKKRGLSQLGQLYYDVGNYSMARGVLEMLVSMESGNEDYLFLLAETYHELDLGRDARDAWLKVLQINQRHVGALRRLYD